MAHAFVSIFFPILLFMRNQQLFLSVAYLLPRHLPSFFGFYSALLTMYRWHLSNQPQSFYLSPQFDLLVPTLPPIRSHSFLGHVPHQLPLSPSSHFLAWSWTL